MKFLLWIAGCFAALSSGTVHADEIVGAGATFPEPLYVKWGSDFQRQTGIVLKYQGTGSGDGIRQIKAGTVGFGASDMPLEHDKLEQSGLFQFPTVVGGVAVVVNVAGIADGALKLDGPVLADIFMGKITRWNAPAISALNPDLVLPDAQINVVHRSDSSGTNFLFTHYLSSVSPAWKAAMGEGVHVEWKTGTGCKGNLLIPICMLREQNSISYMEYAYAAKNHMNFVALKNSSGSFVKPDPRAFHAAAAHAHWEAGKTGFYELLTNQPGAGTWPIVGATYILLHARQEKANSNSNVLRFMDWAYAQGGSIAEEMGYVPLPSAVQNRIRSAWGGNLKDASGAPVCYHDCQPLKLASAKDQK